LLPDVWTVTCETGVDSWGCLGGSCTILDTVPGGAPGMTDASKACWIIDEEGGAEEALARDCESEDEMGPCCSPTTEICKHNTFNNILGI